jgi:L-fuculose-phosphate aldolase
MTSETQARHDLVLFGKKLHEGGHVAATDGNLSIRLDDGRILATPTGMSKGMMHPEDMVIVDLKGKKCCGERNPSSELGMHLLIYNTRPEVNAVVHGHPVTAT